MVQIWDSKFNPGLTGARPVQSTAVLTEFGQFNPQSRSLCIPDQTGQRFPVEAGPIFVTMLVGVLGYEQLGNRSMVVTKHFKPSI